MEEPNLFGRLSSDSYRGNGGANANASIRHDDCREREQLGVNPRILGSRRNNSTPTAQDNGGQQKVDLM
jgi:hypothetical protein